MLMNNAPVMNATLANLGVPNGTELKDGDEARVGVGEFTSRVGLIWNSAEVGGGSNLTEDDGGVWWKELGEGGDFPVVKFGPDLGFLEPLAVYINLMIVVAAIVLVIGVTCRCIAAKVRLSLSGRRGPEIAFHLGATGDVIERVVAVGDEGRQRDGDGFGRDASGDSRGYEV